MHRRQYFQLLQRYKFAVLFSAEIDAETKIDIGVSFAYRYKLWGDFEELMI